jgi:hypothetical protein
MSRNNMMVIVTIIRIKFCLLLILDTLKTNKEAIHCTR